MSIYEPFEKQNLVAGENDVACFAHFPIRIVVAPKKWIRSLKMHAFPRLARSGRF